MPSIINATTTNGLVTSADNSGSLQLATNNGTTAVTIDTSQNVGIGTTATDGVLTVNKANAGHKIVATNGTNVAWSEIGSYAGATNQVKAQLFAEENGASSYVKIGARSNHYCAFTTNDTERMRITSGGEVFIGTASTFDASYKFNLFVDTAHAFITRPNTNKNYNANSFRNSSNSEVGYIFCSNTATSFGTSSDYRLKENIAPMTGALAKVAQLKPVTYKWKVDGSDGQGFIAHELQAVVPDCVTGEKDAVELVDVKDEEGNVIGQEEKPVYQGVDTSFLVATLTAAIQELKAELDTVKAELNTLKNPPVEGTE